MSEWGAGAVQVVMHLGAPGTDEGLLVRTLAANADILGNTRVAIPDPARCRRVLRHAARGIGGRPAGPALQVAILEALLDGPPPTDRLILSEPGFVSIGRRLYDRARIWPGIAGRIARLRALFPGRPVALFVALRNPAHHLPRLFETSRFTDFATFTGHVEPRAVRWSEMLQRLTQAHPDCPVTVWCHEDAPVVWREVLGRVAGAAPGRPLRGGDEPLAAVMAERGLTRLTTYLAERPPRDEAHRRRIVEAFLRRYRLPGPAAQDPALPGWTRELTDYLSEAYEADRSVIARLPGITFVTP